MAMDNLVHLTGMVDGKINVSVVNGFKQASFNLFTLRKRMRTPAGEDESDLIPIFTRDAEMISQIKKLAHGNVISVIGNFCSVNTEKEFCCKNKECREYEVPVGYKGTISYINPIEIMPIIKNAEIPEMDVKLFLHQYREHSNTVRLLGRANTDVKHIPLEVLNRKSGEKELLNLWQFCMNVSRRKLVSASLSKADYITINAYEYEDIKELKSGDFVCINGFVKSKLYKKVRKCPCCGSDIKTQDTSLCVVPYRVEHIKCEREV